jgi:hypothetical protein
VRAGARLAPRQRVHPALDGAVEQPVPGRVELDTVDAVAVAVVRDEPRLVALAALGVLEGGRAPGQRAGLVQPLGAQAPPSRATPSASAGSLPKAS